MKSLGFVVAVIIFALILFVSTKSCLENGCYQEHYWNNFRGVISERFITRDKKIPMMKISINNNEKIVLIGFDNERDTSEILFWQVSSLGDSVLKKERELKYIIKGDSLVEINWKCFE